MSRLLINTFRSHYKKYGSDWLGLTTSHKTLLEISLRIGEMLYNKTYDTLLGIDDVGKNIVPVLATMERVDFKVLTEYVLPKDEDVMNRHIVAVCSELDDVNYNILQELYKENNIVAVATLVKLSNKYEDVHRHVYLYDDKKLDIK